MYVFERECVCRERKSKGDSPGYYGVQLQFLVACTDRARNHLRERREDVCVTECESQRAEKQLVYLRKGSTLERERAREGVCARERESEGDSPGGHVDGAPPCARKAAS